MKYQSFLLAFLVTTLCVACADNPENTVDETQQKQEEQNKQDKQQQELPPIIVEQPSQNCGPNEKMCGGVCVNVTRSVIDCGDCGVKCKTGEWCEAGKCKGCEATQCGSQCVDTTSNANHCGTCNHVCPNNMVCSDSQCVCKRGYNDCDGVSINGCEVRSFCECEVGATRSCYYGPEGTQDVGECKAGTSVCELNNQYLEYSACTGLVLPKPLTAVCTDKDYNCNGIPDGEEDNDNDGYTICDGDVCDTSEMCNVTNPELINPGMIEIPDNGLDDNCDGRVDEVDNAYNDVSDDYVYSSSEMDVTALALARAMEIPICARDDEKCPHGLVKATLTRSGSMVEPDKRQVNVLDAFRDKDGVARILPTKGNAFAVISTGEAVDVKRGVKTSDLELEEIVSEKEISSGVVQRVSKDSKIPDVYANTHEGKLQTHSLCPTKAVTPAIFDSVQLHLEIKVPKNVKGIKFNFRFLTREYPNYICSAFNDFFLALLTTTASGMDAYPDHNIAFDKEGNPLSVNNGFFTTCNKIICSTKNDCPAFMDCGEDKYCTAGADTCVDGGTAIQAYSPDPYAYTSGVGGGTAWLATTAPVVGGETIALDFYLWDTQDRKYDSTVLLDNFQWLLDETVVNTVIAKEEEIIVY